ncbi:hypothetical protein L207DRAFT_560479 [Hyaloscypha variabilis F]|uniref:Uncharacterized protein n=1 Tax=Hyaloscypha variabilis (strain UAMH 11265 / GT02V1 / F) TaxID=1149755 RepID=A0A2J6SDV5_HYAVF|nr:hypothetical protein L207DRAFT_560479 [Hyaloscypha variabilis F]
MDESLIDDHLEIVQQHFRSVLCHCKDMDGELLQRKIRKHNAEMLIIAGGMFPQHPTPSNSPNTRNRHRHSRALARDSYAPSISSSRSLSPASTFHSRKRKQDGASPKKRKLVSRGEARPAQMTAEPVDKPNGGRARSYYSQPITTTNMFGKVNSKLPRATKAVVEIPSKKQKVTVDLTGFDDSDDDSAGSVPETESEQVGPGRRITVGEVSKNYLDLQRAVEESLKERDCNGLTREEKEMMRGGRPGEMKEVSEVDEEVLAGFKAARQGEWGDHELEMGIMYDEEEGGEAMFEDEEAGGEVMHEDEVMYEDDGMHEDQVMHDDEVEEGGEEAEDESPPKRRRSI